MKPHLLDLFCGAGGAAMGYHRAGFEVVGVDINPQPHYPFEFHQADALQVLEKLLDNRAVAFEKDNFQHLYILSEIDAIHASPPCEFGSRMTAKHCLVNHENLIPDTRARLRNTGKPFTIENIPDNRRHLINPFMLCGTMFGLYLHRHRYFETSPVLYFLTNTCIRIKEPVLVTGCSRRKNGRREYKRSEISEAMNINWMLKTELDKAIPPAYTEYIGKYLMQVLAPEVKE